MPQGFLLYGSTGFVGSYIAHQAVQQGLHPIIAGRNAEKVKNQAQELGVDYRVFDLGDAETMDKALGEVSAVLHCAGPFHYTSKQMVEGCLRTHTHYLDLSGDIPVLESLIARDEDARNKGIMILPGVGLDIVPTDCLSVHLKKRLPSATKLTLAYHSDGPAKLPPGTAKTAINLVTYGTKIRLNGKLESTPRGLKRKTFDFGQGPINAIRLTWGDLFTAFYSTGIPNIEVYGAMTKYVEAQKALSELLHPLFKLNFVRNYFKRTLKAGSTPEELAGTRTHVWGEVEDDRGIKLLHACTDLRPGLCGHP